MSAVQGLSGGGGGGIGVRDEFHSGGGGGGEVSCPNVFIRCLKENQVVLPEYYFFFFFGGGARKFFGGGGGCSPMACTPVGGGGWVGSRSGVDGSFSAEKKRKSSFLGWQPRTKSTYNRGGGGGVVLTFLP